MIEYYINNKKTDAKSFIKELKKDINKYCLTNARDLITLIEINNKKYSFDFVKEHYKDTFYKACLKQLNNNFLNDYIDQLSNGLTITPNKRLFNIINKEI